MNEYFFMKILNEWNLWFNYEFFVFIGHTNFNFYVKHVIHTLWFQVLLHALFSLTQKCAKAQTEVSIVRSHTHMPSHRNHGLRKTVVGCTEPVLAADRPGPLSESPNRDCYRCHVDFAESVARISSLA